ncbi:MAG: alpha/beta fold hydrolase [Jatrophihabitans sp.]
MHGTPGCRLNRPVDMRTWTGSGFSVVTMDRPGYGLSSPWPGRSVADIADDAAAVMDHLGYERFAVRGGSGGGPHALACAARLPHRVLAAEVVSGGAPLTAEEIDQQVEQNRESFRALAAGRDALVDRFESIRSRVLADAHASFDELHADAPASDRRITAAQRERYAETMSEALTQGVGGWLEDMLAIHQRPWGVDLGAIQCPVAMWHGTDDLNVPVSAARRLAAAIPTASFHELPGVGHTGADPAAALQALLARARKSLTTS